MLEVGKTVFLKPVNNEARRSKEIKEKFILKIGRKYFFVGKEGETVDKRTLKFSIDTLYQENKGYAPNWQVYFDKQEIFDEREFYELISKIRKEFTEYGKLRFTLNQLRRISVIMDE